MGPRPREIRPPNASASRCLVAAALRRYPAAGRTGRGTRPLGTLILGGCVTYRTSLPRGWARSVSNVLSLGAGSVASAGHALLGGEPGQDAAVLGFLLYVVGCPEGYRLDGLRRVVAIVRREDPAAHEEKVRHLVRAAVAVDHRLVRIVAHDVGAHFVCGEVVGWQ